MNQGGYTQVTQDEALTAVLQLAKESPHAAVSVRQLQRRLGLSSHSTAWWWMRRLQVQGLITLTPRGRREAPRVTRGAT